LTGAARRADAGVAAHIDRQRLRAAARRRMTLRARRNLELEAAPAGGRPSNCENMRARAWRRR